ncbi:MAG: hypothetical protein ACJ8AW_10340 [Rhodopila sp.]
MKTAKAAMGTTESTTMETAEATPECGCIIDADAKAKPCHRTCQNDAS